MPSVEELIGNPSETLVAEAVYACTRLDEVEARWPLVVREVRDLHSTERDISEDEADRMIQAAVQNGEVGIQLNERMDWCLSIDAAAERKIHRRYWYWHLKGKGIEVFPLYHWPNAIETVRDIVQDWIDGTGSGPTYAQLHQTMDEIYQNEDGAVQSVHQAIESRAIERMGDTFILGDTMPFSWGEE